MYSADNLNMYSYHNRIKQRIRNGELVGIDKGYGEYLFILIFNTYPYTRPIREKAAYKYEYLFPQFGFKPTRLKDD